MICLDKQQLTDAEVKELDAEYDSYGDTVHYSPDPKVFRGWFL